MIRRNQRIEAVLIEKLALIRFQPPHHRPVLLHIIQEQRITASIVDQHGDLQQNSIQTGHVAVALNFRLPSSMRRLHYVSGQNGGEAALSVMPTMPYGNTNAATLMIAEEGADLLLAAAREAG